MSTTYIIRPMAYSGGRMFYLSIFYELSTTVAKLASHAEDNI